MRVKFLHMKQLTALKRATSSRPFSILSSHSWWEMCSSGNRTRSVRPGGKYCSIRRTKIWKFKPEILVEWNAPLFFSNSLAKFLSTNRIQSCTLINASVVSLLEQTFPSFYILAPVLFSEIVTFRLN